MWVLFHVRCPTRDRQTARDLYQKRVVAKIYAESGEVAILLEGDIGLVPNP